MLYQVILMWTYVQLLFCVMEIGEGETRRDRERERSAIQDQTCMLQDRASMLIKS